MSDILLQECFLGNDGVVRVDWASTLTKDLVVVFLLLVHAILQFTELLGLCFLKEASTQNLNITEYGNLLLLKIIICQMICLLWIFIDLSQNSIDSF